MTEYAPLVFSIVGAIFGILASGLMGVIINKLNGIERTQTKISDQFFAHVTASHVHEAGFAKLEEQVKSVLQIARVAHERADRLEAKVESS